MESKVTAPCLNSVNEFEAKAFVSHNLPPAPERPLDSDCCGEGCVPCVMDIYQQELELWQEECALILQGGETHNTLQDISSQEEFKLSTKMYRTFPITKIDNEATDIIRVRCRLPPRQSLGLLLGQHVIIRFFGKDGISITRQYTPVSPLTAKGFFELLIKIYPDGRASQMVKEWKVGDNIEIRGPMGHLNYKSNKFDKVLMLCAGTGVAPMCQVIHTILADEEDDTYLRLIYAARDYSCLMGKEEITEWRRFWNFACLFMLSQEPANAPWRYKHGEEVQHGHVTEEVITQGLGSTQFDKVLVLVCGTRSFDTDVLTCLKKIGIHETNIHRF
ncbi:NADH-cytochrome b5 reductase [Elysia marginata]|uniref:NADH-cytochrome b5 reductase n=1 Tax=Elysia marginata TaxID=1093978 RepID=A0AAV4ECP7_9GAST|nr:NADH-cytochrome b5 reductase [Elysia marginata]